MPLTRGPVGLSLTTSPQTLVTNPGDSAENRTYEVRFANTTAAPGSSADVTQCLAVDASPAAERPVMATNTTVRARETISTRIVLEPGDSIKVAGSAPNTIYASAQQIHAEPST